MNSKSIGSSISIISSNDSTNKNSGSNSIGYNINILLNIYLFYCKYILATSTNNPLYT